MDIDKVRALTDAELEQALRDAKRTSGRPATSSRRAS